MIKVWSFIGSLLGQIVLAVVIVGLLAFFNPGDIFSSTKNTIKDTPILVRSMKEIGQLITAEYYGETVADNFTVVEMDAEEKKNEIDEVIRQNGFFWGEIQEMRDNEDTPKRRNKLEAHYIDNFTILNDSEYANVLLQFYDNKFEKNTRKRLLRHLVHDKKGKKISGIQEKDLRDFMDRLYAKAETPDKVKKKEILVIVGRGWVKAGYDFQDFDPDNFIYAEDEKRIYIAGMEPFMEVTMNPWFIPEKGVEGFEFILMGKEAAHNRETVLKTKKKCKAKLIKQAEDREILQKAKDNAENNMRDFLSLMMDTEIKSVQIHESVMEFYYKYFFLKDTLISRDEFITIESEFLKSRYQDTLKGRDLREFMAAEILIDTLKGQDNTGYSKAAFAEAMGGDGLLNLEEMRRLRTFEINKLDSVWYGALKLEDRLNSGRHYYVVVPKDTVSLSVEYLKASVRDELLEKVQGVQKNVNGNVVTEINPDSVCVAINALFFPGDTLSCKNTW